MVAFELLNWDELFVIFKCFVISYYFIFLYLRCSALSQKPASLLILILIICIYLNLKIFNIHFNIIIFVLFNNQQRIRYLSQTLLYHNLYIQFSIINLIFAKSNQIKSFLWLKITLSISWSLIC